MALFDKGSREYNLLINRVKMGCAAQSRQIDKTKIGAAVKGIPTIWKQFQRATEEDSLEQIQEKNFYNSLLADRKPYFFKYKYNHLNKELNEYNKKNDENCQTRFCMSLKEMLAIPVEKRTSQQRDFIMYYYKFLPVIDSNCVMNRVCKYIEGVDFNIKQKVRSSQDFDYRVLQSPNFTLNKNLYKKIQNVIEASFKEWNEKKKDVNIKGFVKGNAQRATEKVKFDKDAEYMVLKGKLQEITSNEEQLANHLVYLFYCDKPSYNKTVLWALVGKQLYENVKSKTNSFYFPQKNVNGSLEFLYEKYSIERIMLEKEDSMTVLDNELGEGNNVDNYDD